MKKSLKVKTYLKVYTNFFKYVFKKSIQYNKQSLASVAVSSDLICKANRVKAIPHYFWKKQLERIQASRTYNSQQVIQNDFYREYFDFKAVTAYWLKDAALIDGSVYSDEYRHELRSGLNRTGLGFRAGKNCEHLSMAAMASTCAGSTWWGHWVLDEVPMQILAQNYAPLIAFGRKPHYDEKAYYKALDMNEPKLIDTAFFDRLLIIDEHGQNPLKTRRYHEIRNKLSLSGNGHKNIFLKRGGTGTERNLVNEDELQQRLEQEGFITVDISTCNGSELIKTLRGVGTVVGIEGSHLAPLLYLLNKKALIVILNPPCRVLTTIADVGLFCGISSSMFICEPAGKSGVDFYASPEEVIRFIDDSHSFREKNNSRLEIFTDEVLSLGCT